MAWRGWLASVCVCGIPSYPTHTLPILSLHTHWTPAGFSSLLVSCSSQGTQSLLLPSSSSGCQNICRAVSVVKIFSTGCTHSQKGTKLNWDRVWIVSGQMGLRRIPYGRPELSEVPPRLERWRLTATLSRLKKQHQRRQAVVVWPT